MLPCLHSFCVQCLAKIYDLQKEKETLQCPTCNEKAPLQGGMVEALSKDLRKLYEAEVARYSLKVKGGEESCDHCVQSDNAVVAFCINCCEFLCKSCEQHHRVWRKTIKHEIVAASEGKEGNILRNLPQPPMHCSEHDDEVLKFYCKNCEKLVCRDCVVLQHSAHHHLCNRVERVAEEEMRSLLTDVKNSQHAIAALDDAIFQCKMTIQTIESRKKEVDSAITHSVNQVREALLAMNEEVRLGKITCLEMQVSELKRVKDGLSHASSIIAATQSYTPAQQLSTKKVIAERAALFLQQFKNSDLSPLENDLFLTKVAEPTTITQMVALGQVSGGAFAAFSTCDVGYVPQAVVGKKRTIKVAVRDETGEPLHVFHSELVVRAQLSLMGSQEPPIHGKTFYLGDGVYSVTFTAQSAGKHELQVTISNRHVKGSPFTLTARQPRTTPYTSLACQKSIPTKQHPWDVAMTEDGSLVVVEHNYHTVSLYSKDGEQQYTFGIGSGRSGSGDGQFNCPSGVAINGDMLYVSEHGNNRVQKFSISQQCFISKFGRRGSGIGQFSSPRGICIDPEGKVYVADSGNNRIQVFQADGTFAHCIVAYPTNASSVFQCPWGLAFDLEGHLHIAAYKSHCIKVFTAEGTFVKSYGSDTLQYPVGISINEEGYIAITEKSNRLLIYNLQHTKPVGTTTGSGPAGITCDADGMFWVANRNNNQVQRY